MTGPALESLLHPGGALLVENEVRVARDLRDLPRVGVVVTLPPGLEQLEWFGSGPWENYADRLAATIVGRLSSTHTSDLEPRAEVVLSLDHAQRGLGTASCGPDTAPRYQARRRPPTGSRTCSGPSRATRPRARPRHENAGS